MHKIFLFFCLTFLIGCGTLKPVILTDSERFYIIPANTTFHAVLEKNGPTTPVARDKDTWCGDAGRIIELEEKANSCTMSQ